MDDPRPLELMLIGPPRLDGSGVRSAQWRRALVRRELSSAAAVLLFGPLTAHARPAEAASIPQSLAVAHKRVLVRPAPGDMPQQGKAPGWLTRLGGDTMPPRPIALGDRRTTLIPLDTLRMDGGRDAIGPGQLTALETLLAARPPTERTVLAMAHDPRGKPAEGRPLADCDALGKLLKRHPVALIAHGQGRGFTKGRFVGIPTICPPPLDGCGITGWRALIRVSWATDAADAAPRFEPIHFARPEDRPALAEAFAVADAAGAWTALAEKIVAADDTFAALAAEMQARALRLDALAEHGASLDGALADLIRRAGGEP